MIVFAYGIPKSASTFAYQLLRRLHLAAGFSQPSLPQRLRGHSHLNFMPNLSDDLINVALYYAAETRLVIKTHRPPTAHVRKLLRAGEAVAYASYRDPKDVSLALVDAGRRERNKGIAGPFRQFHCARDTIAHLHEHVLQFSQWIFSGAIPLPYEELCFQSSAVAIRVGESIGMDGEMAQQIAVQVHSNRRKLEQWGKGVPHRHRQDMGSAECEEFDKEFAAFYRYFPEICGGE